MQGVLHREEPTPRLAEQNEVASVEMESLTHLFDLVDESSEVPERGVIGLIASK